MRGTLRFLLSLSVALLSMLLFRALVLTVYTVEGEGLAPSLIAGDRVMVNRWSYGLRTGSAHSLFSYGRWGRQPVSRGDIVVFEDPRATADDARRQWLICRCEAIPGDTVTHDGRMLVVPGLKDCADADYYWMGALGEGNDTDSHLLGFISEQLIIGRAFLIVYSHSSHSTIPWKGWNGSRFLLPL